MALYIDVVVWRTGEDGTLYWCGRLKNWWRWHPILIWSYEELVKMALYIDVVVWRTGEDDTLYWCGGMKNWWRWHSILMWSYEELVKMALYIDVVVWRTGEDGTLYWCGRMKNWWRWHSILMWSDEEKDLTELNFADILYWTLFAFFGQNQWFHSNFFYLVTKFCVSVPPTAWQRVWLCNWLLKVWTSLYNCLFKDSKNKMGIYKKIPSNKSDYLNGIRETIMHAHFLM